MTLQLAGKVVLITGATEGIGKAAALEFAKRGATLTIVGRNKQKSEAVLAELKSASGNPNIELLLCDLSKLADVRRAAAGFRATHDRLDILALNAGAMFPKPTLGADGYELTFALNHLAHFQLTTSLLDLISKTPGARVVSTSSSMQSRARFDLASTPTTTEGSGATAYANAKLANILFTKELQRRLEGTAAIANCFHPGIVKTKFGAFGADFGLFHKIVYSLAAPFAKTPEQGADTLVWLATSPEAGSLKGEYVSNRRVVTPSAAARDSQLAADLWSVSERLCDQASGHAGVSASSVQPS